MIFVRLGILPDWMTYPLSLRERVRVRENSASWLFAHRIVFGIVGPDESSEETGAWPDAALAEIDQGAYS
jgi:hypothetical protein